MDGINDCNESKVRWCDWNNPSSLEGNSQDLLFATLVWRRRQQRAMARSMCYPGTHFVCGPSLGYVIIQLKIYCSSDATHQLLVVSEWTSALVTTGGKEILTHTSVDHFMIWWRWWCRTITTIWTMISCIVVQQCVSFWGEERGFMCNQIALGEII